MLISLSFIDFGCSMKLKTVCAVWMF